MTMFKPIFLLFLILLSHQIFAGGGHIIGNGGDIIFCPKAPSAERVQLLDFYEIKLLNSVDVELPENSSFLKILDTMIQRVILINPDLGNTLKKYQTEFDREATYLEDVDLTNAEDSLHVALPKGCEIQQAVLQVEPRFSGDSRYIFDKNIWTQLSEKERAGLVFHELVYRVLIANTFSDHKSINSKDVRFFTGLVAGDKVLNILSINEFHWFISKKLRFKCIDPIFSSDKTSFRCSKKTDSQLKVLKSTRWKMTAPAGGGGDVEMVTILDFQTNGILKTTETCLFKKYYGEDHKDVVVQMSFPVLVDDKNIAFEKNWSKTERDPKNQTFCVSEFLKGNFEYEIRGQKLLLWGYEFFPIESNASTLKP